MLRAHHAGASTADPGAGRRRAERPASTGFRAFKIDVLRMVDGAIAEITTFGPKLFPAFDLPAVLA
jgi:hypothetical protein